MDIQYPFFARRTNAAASPDLQANPPGAVMDATHLELALTREPLQPAKTSLPAPPPQVVYLGVSGVLHPSASLYKLIYDKDCWAQGHTEYEGVAYLERVLEGWPSVRIVLTSTQVWANGLQAVLQSLGTRLAARVIGYAFEDLTVRAKLGTHGQPMSPSVYWSMTRAEVVRHHVAWLRPDAWIAVDDEAALWTTDERRGHCVLTDPCKGLLDPMAQDRLMTLLVGNFGISPDV